MRCNIVVLIFIAAAVACDRPRARQVATARCRLTVQTASTHPSNMPVILQLTVTNVDPSAVPYHIVGEGSYPDTELLVAEISDAAGNVKSLRVLNDRYFNGNAPTQYLDQGQSLSIPATIGALPLGKYTLAIHGARQAPELFSEVSPSSPIILIVADQPSLREQLVTQIQTKARNREPFYLWLTRQSFATTAPAPTSSPTEPASIR